MRRQLFPSIVSMVIFTVVLGIAFPLVVLGIGQLAFPDKANGSLIECKGKPVGSSLIGQAFTTAKGKPLPEYFQSRPSAAAGASGDTAAGYDPTLSSGSNLGPTNPDFLKTVGQRVKDYRELNGLSANAEVPVDAVTASGSGLDPHISVANARLQASRVADERGLSKAKVNQLIDDNTTGRAIGFLGEKAVNVVELNLALDRRDGRCS
jgi:potassium-transporting ATPase KdpC subunit